MFLQLQINLVQCACMLWGRYMLHMCMTIIQSSSREKPTYVSNNIGGVIYKYWVILFISLVILCSVCVCLVICDCNITASHSGRWAVQFCSTGK